MVNANTEHLPLRSNILKFSKGELTDYRAHLSDGETIQRDLLEAYRNYSTFRGSSSTMLNLKEIWGLLCKYLSNVINCSELLYGILLAFTQEYNEPFSEPHHCAEAIFRSPFKSTSQPHSCYSTFCQNISKYFWFYQRYHKQSKEYEKPEK